MRLGSVRNRTVVEGRDGLRALAFDGDLSALVAAELDPRQLDLGELVEEPLGPPLRPGKIVAIGLNYLDHIREQNAKAPERPVVFAKFPSSVTGPGDPIVVDSSLTQRVDWEVELAVGVAELLAFCSRSFTLEPGDVVLTGTPWGVGEFMDPPRSLRPGDVVETEIEGIGVLRNPVVEAGRFATDRPA